MAFGDLQLGQYAALNAYPPTGSGAISSNPFSSGGGQASVWTTQGTGGVQTPPETGKATGANQYQQDINEVGIIGAQKAEGFRNGLGGTNNPDDHKLFMVA